MFGNKRNLNEMTEQQNNSIDSINVVMYSYKSKDAIKTLENLMKTWSKKIFIFIHWHDQNGVDRSKLLIDLINSYDLCNGAYIPVHWDDIDGAVLYKDLRLKATFGGRYHMTITPGAVLEQDWDLKLIDFVVDKNIIVSGNKKTEIFHKNLFFIDKKYTEIDNFALTNYIDRNFIFGNVTMMKNNLFGQYNFPGWLKYYGEEEVLSLQYFKDSIKVYAAPENIIKINRYSTLDDFNYYVPFSKYHNYNEAISLFKNNENSIIGKIDPEIVNNFNKFHNFSFNGLHYLPFSTNDVSYSITDSRYDKMDGRRFIKQIQKVD
jgi:hypothetical protein